MGEENSEFRNAFKKGFTKLTIALRRQQIRVAMKGNVPMLIWLGKQLLGQRDGEMKSDTLMEWEDLFDVDELNSCVPECDETEAA